MLQRKRENDLLKLRINNDFGFQKENFTIQKNESGNVRNEPQPYLINYDINSCKKSFCDSLNNSNQKLNNKINIINILIDIYIIFPLILYTINIFFAITCHLM